MYIQIITPFQIQVINIHWRKGNSDNENSMRAKCFPSTVVLPNTTAQKTEQSSKKDGAADLSN